MPSSTFVAFILSGFAIDAAFGAVVPSYVSRHRARHASMPGLKVVNGDIKQNSYLIRLADTISNRTAHIEWADSMVASSGVSTATAVNSYVQDVFNGYSAELDDECVQKLIASQDVAWVEEDAVVRIKATQTNAPWGLSRLTSGGPLPAGSDVGALDFGFTFDDVAGEGVDVYIIDTGIRTTHQDYEGRAEMIFSLAGLADTDDNGHGSHVAGTIGGAVFGVAKKANLFGIKVMDADGAGSTSGIIRGIQVAVQAAAQSNRPSVVNMSIGGSASLALDNAANAAVQQGLFVVVAAGNDAVDSSGDSPARAANVITVGAMNIQDRVSSFSNFGAPVDIFAPGEDILSVGIQSDTDVASLSGTSMATPHIAGLVALLASQQQGVTPAQMLSLLQSTGSQNILRGVPRRTVNLLAQIQAITGADPADATTTLN